jgi:hypothetical protein
MAASTNEQVGSQTVLRRQLKTDVSQARLPSLELGAGEIFIRQRPEFTAAIADW